jgi:hypothetical protein
MMARPRLVTPTSTMRPRPSASRKNVEASSRADFNSPRTSANVHWPWAAAKRSEKSSVFAASSVARANAALVSSEAKPLEYITACP